MQTPIETSSPLEQTGSRPARFWVHYIMWLTLAIALALYVYPSSGYFLYDDARMILQNRPSDTLHLARAFVELRDNFYRPLFEITIGLESLLFSVDPLGYHLFNVFVHLLTSTVVYAIGRLLIDRKAALIVVAYFLASTVHAEPIMWISGLTSLLPGFFAAVSFASYLLFDLNKASNRVAYLGSLGAWVLALLSKESAYTLPLTIVVFHILLSPRPKRVVIYRLVPFLILMAAYAPLRLAQGTGYSINNLDMGPLALTKNAFAYLIAAFVPLPDDYRYPSTIALWRSEPILPSVVLALGFSSFLILLAFGFVPTLKRKRAIWFGIAWVMLTLLPVLPIYAERQLYLPSIGAAISVGAVFAGCMGRARTHRQVVIIGSALVLLLAASLLGLAERSYWWKKSGDLSREVTQVVLDETDDLKPGAKLILLGVPDTLRITHVQGPHLPDTIQLASNNLISAKSVFIGSYLWPAPENANHSLRPSIVNDPSAVVIDLRRTLEARGITLPLAP